MNKRFEMRVMPEWLAHIDAWRRRQPDLPSRAEAVRLLVARGLGVNSFNLSNLIGSDGRDFCGKRVMKAPGKQEKKP
jgi:hypothetical protein